MAVSKKQYITQYIFMDQDIIKFNSNSKEFLLNWSHVSDVKTRTDIPSSGILSDRGNKFITRPEKAISKKVGSPEVVVRTPLLSPQISRNEKERSTFYIGENDFRLRSTVSPPTKTAEDWNKIAQKHEAAKTDRMMKKKQEVSRLEDQKWSRLKKKLQERQPFRF